MTELHEESSEFADVRKQWLARAKAVKTPQEAADFIQHLLEDYRHDYGTIVHACALGALAGAYAVNNDSVQGGLTGAQAGFVHWMFLKAWSHLEGPARLVRYENMLYPQYDREFDKTIDARTWEWLQEQAKQKLAEGRDAHPDIKLHWQNIAAGYPPFGYTVRG